MIVMYEFYMLFFFIIVNRNVLYVSVHIDYFYYSKTLFALLLHQPISE